MIDQILSGLLSKQLIHDLDCSIALNKGFVLALNYKIWLLKLNSSKHIKTYAKLLKTQPSRGLLAAISYEIFVRNHSNFDTKC